MLWLLLALPALSRCSGGEELWRRLEQRAEGAELRELQAGDLDERGWLPEPEVAGLRLRETFLVPRSEPWRPLHASVPAEYRSAGRRLSLAPLLQRSINLNGPRSRALGLAVINAAALPAAAYNLTGRWSAWGPLSRSEQWWPRVYQDGKQAFAPTLSPRINTTTTTTQPLVNSSFAVGFGGSCVNDTCNTDTALDSFRRDMQQLLEARQQAKDITGIALKHKFLGHRSTPCSSRTDTDEMCLEDVGVALSIYEDVSHRVLVFHGAMGAQEWEYSMWLHKAWVIEKFEEALRLMWTIKARQPLQTGMMGRRGTTAAAAADEKRIRCKFKDTTHAPAPELLKLATAAGVSTEELEELGLWALTKRLLRLVLPADGSRPHGDRKLILTGFGLGGTRAALASMYLVKADNIQYPTYVFGAVGWECAARRLYQQDMYPWDTHSQITAYSHVMDAVSNGLDRLPVRVCLFGRQSFAPGTAEHGYCAQVVGFTGPQLLHRGDPPAGSEVERAREAFQACLYYTHSPWYAALLLLSENTLMIDGTTDGGCFANTPIPQQDRLESCPTLKAVEKFCATGEAQKREVPIVLLAGVSGGILAILCGMGLAFYMCLRQLRNDAWVFGKDAYGNEMRIFWFLDWFSKTKTPALDKARAARERAHARRRKAVMRERERQIRRNATEEEKKVLKQERAAKKAAKQATKDLERLDEDGTGGVPGGSADGVFSVVPAVEQALLGPETLGKPTSEVGRKPQPDGLASMSAVSNQALDPESSRPSLESMMSSPVEGGTPGTVPEPRERKEKKEKKEKKERSGEEKKEKRAAKEERKAAARSLDVEAAVATRKSMAL